MDAPYEIVAFPEIAPPPLRGIVWVLGQKYKLPQGRSSKMKDDEILLLSDSHVCVPLPSPDKALMTDDVRSRLWCTYRKNFRAIGMCFVSVCPGNCCRPAKMTKSHVPEWVWLQVPVTSWVRR